MAALAEAAPDLATKVVEDDLTLGEALGALGARWRAEEERRRQVEEANRRDGFERKEAIRQSTDDDERRELQRIRYVVRDLSVATTANLVPARRPLGPRISVAVNRGPEAADRDLMPSSDRWMSTREVSEDLGITLRTLYRIIDDGQLPAYKFGRVIRLQRADVEAFLETARVRPGDLAHLVAGRSLDDELI